MIWSGQRPWLVAAMVVAIVGTALTVALGVRAQGVDLSRCERFTAESRARAAAVTGSGLRVVVIGDSWSAGLGLDRPARSWPARLPGQVRVAGFSGSGFSADASPCPAVSFAERASAALDGDVDLVVVEGGLNDFDQPASEIRRGFARLMGVVGERPVVVVGPASAPSRASQVPQVDAVLADLARSYDVAYVDTTGLDLSYLDDRLHLTAAGHDAFGDYVAQHIADLVGPLPS